MVEECCLNMWKFEVSRNIPIREGIRNFQNSKQWGRLAEGKGRNVYWELCTQHCLQSMLFFVYLILISLSILWDSFFSFLFLPLFFFLSSFFISLFYLLVLLKVF